MLERGAARGVGGLPVVGDQHIIAGVAHRLDGRVVKLPEAIRVVLKDTPHRLQIKQRLARSEDHVSTFRMSMAAPANPHQPIQISHQGMVSVGQMAAAAGSASQKLTHHGQVIPA